MEHLITPVSYFGPNGGHFGILALVVLLLVRQWNWCHVEIGIAIGAKTAGDEQEPQHHLAGIIYDLHPTYFFNADKFLIGVP